MSDKWGGVQFDRDGWPNVCAAIDALETAHGLAMEALRERERFIAEQLKQRADKLKSEEEAND